MTTNQTRIVIADDHGVLRAGLQALITAQADMSVVGEARDGLEVVRVATETQPDVAILDVEMPHSGEQAVRRLLESSPNLKVLILTMYDDPSLVRRLLEAGASGYVVKDALGDELMTAVRAVREGRRYISISLHNEGWPPAAVVPDLPQAARSLSRREREVMELLAKGFTNQEIGERLHLSARTVGTYRGRLSEKLGLETRADIVRYAMDLGLLDRDTKVH
jgi:two-component system response regulator NreC